MALPRLRVTKMGRKTAPHEADLAVGLALKAFREKRRMSMADVGRAVGWPYQQVQRYESGNIRISFSKLTELAHALGTTADEIAATATGTRPDYGPQVERLMFRISLRLSKLPPQHREGAAFATLAFLDTYMRSTDEES